MRVVCENCGATYKIPDAKLVKEVNKATCRKCGFRMTIHRPGLAAVSLEAAADPEAEKATEPDEAATVVTANPLQQQEGEKELLEAATRIEKGPVAEWSDEAPTQVRLAEEVGAPAPPTPPTAPTAPTFQEPPRSSAPKPAPGSGRAPNDMLLALAGTFASAGGALLLATNTAGHGGQRMFGLGIALWGALTCLFLLVTGNMWRQKGNMPISFALATVLAIGGSGFVEVALHGADLQSLISDLEMLDSKPSARPPPPPVDKPSAEDGLADGTEDEEADPDGEASTEEDPEAGTATDEDGDATADAAEPKGGAAAPSGDREVPEEVAEDPETLDEPDIEELEIDSRNAAEERRRKEMEAAATAASERRTRREEERVKKAELEAAKAAARAAAAERAARAAPPPPPPAASPAKMKSLPLTVVDTLIRTNLSVKKCFFEEKNRSGTLPHRVAVRFTILTSGRVTSARVITDQYKGTPLDSCLGRSFKAIKFPAFEGETISMTYPFVL